MAKAKGFKIYYANRKVFDQSQIFSNNYTKPIKSKRRHDSQSSTSAMPISIKKQIENLPKEEDLVIENFKRELEKTTLYNFDWVYVNLDNAYKTYVDRKLDKYFPVNTTLIVEVANLIVEMSNENRNNLAKIIMENSEILIYEIEKMAWDSTKVDGENIEHYLKIEEILNGINNDTDKLQFASRENVYETFDMMNDISND